MNLIILTLAAAVFFPAQAIESHQPEVNVTNGVTHWVVKGGDRPLQVNLNRGSARGCREVKGRDDECLNPNAKPKTVTVMSIKPDKTVHEATFPAGKMVCWHEKNTSSESDNLPSAEYDDCVSNRGYWLITVPVKTDWAILGLKVELEP